MPTPVAYGAAVSFKDPAFSATYSPGNVDVGTAGGVWVAGWAWVEASSAIARVNSVTIGGVAMTLGTDLDRNALLGSPSRMRKFSGFLPGKTGAQALVITQTDTSGVASSAGKIRIDLQVYNLVTSVVSEVDTPVTAASSNVVSAAFTSAAGRTDVWVAHTPINQSGGTAMAVMVTAPVVLRSASAPQANETIIVDRPGAASSTLAATITGSFTPYSVGTLYSLSGDAGGDATAPTLTGTITQGVTTSTSIAVTWPAGADNVAVTGYEVSSDGGTTYVASNGATATTTAHTFTALSASTAYQIRVRAKDAAGNVSTPAIAATFSTSAAPASGTITSNPLVRNTGTASTDAWALWGPGQAFTAYVHNLTTGALLVKRTGLLTNASGVFSFTDAAVPAAASYRVDIQHEATGVWGVDILNAI